MLVSESVLQLIHMEDREFTRNGNKDLIPLSEGLWIDTDSLALVDQIYRALIVHKYWEYILQTEQSSKRFI